MTISLVIPARNEEGQIGDCLRSALSQRLAFDEIVVVDNSSTDATAQIAASFPGVKVISEPKAGIVYARNRGFDAAQSTIIARIDADTVLPPNWSQQVANFYSLQNHNHTAWTSSGRFSDVPLPALVSVGYRLITVQINQLLTGYPTLWGSSSALPAAAWQDIRHRTCRGQGFHEDLDLTTHLHDAGYNIFWDKSITVTAQLRHAHGSAKELWNYLQWWPQTLRRHGNRLWPICWVGGSLLMFGATWAFTRVQILLETVAGRKRQTHVPTSLEV